MKKFILNFIRRLFGLNVLIEEFEKINHFNKETSDNLNSRINDLESKILETKESIDTSSKIQNEIINIQNKILTKHEINSINIEGSFNWFAETIRAVEEYYVPVKDHSKITMATTIYKYGARKRSLNSSNYHASQAKTCT